MQHKFKVGDFVYFEYKNNPQCSPSSASGCGKITRIFNNECCLLKTGDGVMWELPLKHLIPASYKVLRKDIGKLSKKIKQHISQIENVLLELEHLNTL